MKRTEYCGKFGEQHRGTRQQAAGWVQNKRDMGGVIFLDLKDREGVLQVVCDASELGGDFALAEAVRLQSVVAVEGVVRRRSEAEAVHDDESSGSFIHAEPPWRFSPGWPR